MKRLLLTLFVILLMHSALAEEVSHITVANPNPIIGSFFTSLWGRGTSDFDVKSLIHGYDLIRWDRDRKSTRLNSSHNVASRMPSSA